MRQSSMPSRTNSASPDNSSVTSRRSSWGRSRRTFMACTECRRRQVKCTPSESAGQACERCAKRKIKCEFMSIQEQKLLSTPDNDQPSDSITLYLPQYGGAVGGVSGQVSTGPILGDPADVRQGMFGAPANHPLRPTGMPIPASSWPLYQEQQQMIPPSAQGYHRPGTPSWNIQQHPQSSPPPSSRYSSPSMTPVPQSATPAPTWYPVSNSQSQTSNPGYYPQGPVQVGGAPDVQWKDPRDNKQS